MKNAKEQWETLIQRLMEGKDDPLVLVSELLARLSAETFHADDAGHVRLDTNRQSRCGYAEVLYGPGKSIEVLRETVQRQIGSGMDVLVTRVSEEQARALRKDLPGLLWNETARTLRWPSEPTSASRGMVKVVTAGTSDLPVAEEAMETLRWMRIGCELIGDIGVAGPWRLLQVVPRLRQADALVVVAGMEGALPSAVAGWVSCPVIAVPTSVGYGASLGGIAALLGMLNSCAANVSVVNIDAGFKAAYIAGMIAQPGARKREDATSS